MHRVRPWYRPHAASVVVAVLAAGLFVALNLSGYARVNDSRGLHWQNGWPFAVLRRSVYTIGGGDSGLAWAVRPAGDVADGHFSSRALFGDLVVAIAGVAVVIAFAELRIRRKGRLAQFSVSEMLTLLSLAGILFGYEMSVYRREREVIAQLTGRRCHFYVDEGIPDWLRSAPLRGRLLPFDRVTSADLSGPHCTGDGLAPIKKLRSLVFLKLSGRSVDDGSLHHVQHLPRLAWLSTSSCRVTDAGLSHLAGLDELRWLDLSSTRIQGAGLRYLRSMRRLKSLELANTFINDDGMSHISALVSLERLNLCFTSITDRGTAPLIACRRLKVLELAGTNITDESLSSLAKLRKLKKLDVRYTQVSEAGLAAFRAARPDCEVLQRY